MPASNSSIGKPHGASLVLLIVLLIGLLSTGHAIADDLDVHPELSPEGKWLAVLYDSKREIPDSAPDGGKSYEYTGQWVFRLDLTAAKPKPELLHRVLSSPRGADPSRYEDIVVLDDGAVLAVRSSIPQLTRWDAKLNRSDKKLFDGEGHPFVRLHLRPDGKELVIHKQGLRSQDREVVETYRLDLATDRAERFAPLDSLMDYEIYWSSDLKHIFGTESLEKNSEGGKERYQLVRLDLSTGERKPIAQGVWFYGNCFGGSWIAWMPPEGQPDRGSGRKYETLKVSTSEPFESSPVSGLAGWQPVVAIDEDRLVCRSLDWKKHAVASISKGQPKPLGIPTPASNRALLHSRTLKALVLFARGKPTQCEVRDYEGKVLKKITLDLKAPVKGGK